MKILSTRNVLIFLLVLMPVIFAAFLAFKSPSNNREWSPDQQLLSYAEFDPGGDQVHIRNIRNIAYRSVNDYTVSHYNRTVRLSELSTLDYMVEELDGFPGFAHTLLSFGFEDSTYIAVSVEIRKEAGESYHPLSGMLREYELMYVIADERDVINLRANYRKNRVYLYPVEIKKESLKNLFVSMLQKANSLRERPEFYHTLTSTCTTNLARSASESTEESFFAYHPQILLPGFSDRLLLRRGLIRTDLKDIEEVRNAFLINEAAAGYRDSEQFSFGIREGEVSGR